MDSKPENSTSPSFLRVRTIAFCVISLLSFAWAVLLCVDLYGLWKVMDQPQRSLVTAMLAVQVLTIFILLILLVITFKPWLDATRMALLLLTHIGMATAFTVTHSSFQCYTDVEDQQGVCQLSTILILMGSWIVPALLLVYTAGLAFMVYRRRIARRQNSSPYSDLEKPKRSRTSLPIMDPSEEFKYDVDSSEESSSSWDPMHSKRNTWANNPNLNPSRKSTSAYSHHSRSMHASTDFAYGPPMTPTWGPHHAKRTTWNPPPVSIPNQHHSRMSTSTHIRTPSEHTPPTPTWDSKRSTWTPPAPSRASINNSQFSASVSARISKPLPIATVW